MYIKCDRCKKTVDDENCFSYTDQLLKLNIFKLYERLVCFDCIGHQCCYPYYEQKYFQYHEGRSDYSESLSKAEHDEGNCILKDYKPKQINVRV
jgi:hypothetical protein